MANITVDIQAKVVGYEQSIKALQAALAKVDPGSDIGKKLAAALAGAQKQVQELSRNMFPKAASETAIDTIVEKVNRAGAAIQDVSALFQNLSIGDLKLGSLGTEINSLIGNLNQLQTSVNTTLNTGIQDAVGNSSVLSSVFQQLGVNLKDITVEGGQMALSQGLQDATANAEETAAALAEASTKVADLKSEMQSMKASSNFLADGFDIQQILGDLNNIKDPEKLISMDKLDNIKTAMIERLTQTKFNDQGTATSIIENIFGTIDTTTTLETFKQKIAQLKQDLIAAGMSKTDTNNTVGGGNGTELFRSILGIDETQLEESKVRLRAIVETFKDSFSTNSYNTVIRLIDEGSLTKASNQAIKSISDHFDKVTAEYKKKKDETEQAIAAEGAAKLANQDANSQVAQYTNANNEYNNIVKNLEQQVESQKQEIANLRQQINALAEKGLAAVQGTAGAAGTNAGKNTFPTDEAKKYKTELSSIHSAEQMVGKLQGVVQRWFSVYAVVRMVSNAIKNIINNAKELDQTITEIAIVTNMDQSQLWGQMDQYIAMAREYGTSISGAYKVSQLYYQQGLGQADVMELSAQTLKMASISGLDYAQATDYMTNAVRSFKMEMQDAQTVVDTYSAIAAKSATSVTELATAMSKTASSAQSVGASLQNTTAMMAVMIEATRESPENIGSAMKSIISRYGELKENKTGIDEEGEEYSLNKVDKALQSVGISIHDTKGEFRDFDDVIMELSESWDKIDKNTQRYIATVMAGNRQQSRFLALVSSGERLKELTETAADSEDASQAQFLKKLDSIEYKSQQVQTSLQSLWAESGVQDLIKGTLDGINNIIQSFSGLAQAFDSPIAAIIKFGAQFANIARIVTTTFGLIKSTVARQIDAMRSEGIQKAQQAADQEVTIEQNKNQRILESKVMTDAYMYGRHQKGLSPEDAKKYSLGLFDTGTNEAGQKLTGKEKIKALFGKGGKGLAIGGYAASLLGAALSTAAMSMGEDTQPERNKKAQTTFFGSTLTGAGMGAMFGPWGAAIGGLVGAVSGAIQAIEIRTESAEERTTRLNKELETAKNENIAKKQDFKNLDSIIKEYEKLRDAHLESAEAAEEYREKCNQIAEEHPDLVSGYDAEGNAVLNLAAAYEQLKLAKQDENDSAEKAADAALQVADNNILEAEKVSAQAHAEENTAEILASGKVVDSRVEDISDLKSYVDNTMSAYIENTYGAYRVGDKSIQKFASEARSWRIASGTNEDFLQHFPELVMEYEEVLTTYESQLRSLSGFEVVYAYLDKQRQLREETEKSITEEVSASEKADAATRRKRAAKEATVISMSGTIAQGYINERLLTDQGINSKYLSEFANSKTLSGRYLALRRASSTNQAEFFQKEAEGAFNDFDNALASWWTITSQSNKDILDDLVSNQGNYTQIEAQSILHDLGLDDENNAIYQSVMSYYNNNLTTVQDIFDQTLAVKGKRDKTGRIGRIITGTTGYTDDGRYIDEQVALEASFMSKLGENEKQTVSKFYNNILDAVNDQTISEDTGAELTQLYVDTWTSLTSDAPIFKDNEKLRQKAQALLKDSDFTSEEGVNAFLEGLNELGIALDQIGLDKEQFKLNLPKNFGSKVQAYGQEVSQQMANFEKDISSATKGMNLADATKMADNLNISLTKFRQVGNKFFLDDTKLLEDYYFKDREKNIQKLQDAQASEIQNLEGFHYFGTDLDTLVKGIKDENSAFSSLGKDADERMKALFDRSDIIKMLNKSAIDPGVLKAQIKDYLENGKESESFLSYMKDHFAEEYKAYVEASEKAMEYSTASSYLTNGNIDTFLEYTGAKKTTDDFFKGSLSAAREEADAYNQELATRIATGDISNLPKELEQYGKLIYDTFNQVKSSVISSVFDALGGGNTTTFVTSTNQAFLQNMKATNADWIKNDLSDITEGKQIEFDVNKITEDSTTFANWIRANASSKKQALEWLAQFNKIRYPKNTSTVSEMITDTDTISYEQFQSYIDAIGKDATHLELFLKDYGLTSDGFGGFKIKDYDKYIAQLENELKGMTNLQGTDSYKTTLTQLESAKRARTNKQKVDTQKAIDDVIKDADNVSAEAYDFFQTAIGDGNSQQIEKYFTAKGDGTYKLNAKQLRQDIQNNQFTITEEAKRSYLESFAQIGDQALDASNNALSLINKGTTKQQDMQKIVNEFKGKYSQDELFTYDEILNTYTFNISYLQEYLNIQAQKYADAMGVSFNEALAEVSKQTSETLASQINISDFLSAETRQVGSEARTKLETALQNYLDVFGEIPEWISHIPLSAQEDAKRGWQESQIRNIIDTLESGGENAVKIAATIAKAQGRELSASEIETAYRAQVSQIEDAFEQITFGPGGLISGTAVDILKVLADQGKANITLLDDGKSAVINSITDIAEAYAEYYRQLAATGEATLAALNEAKAKVLETQDGRAAEQAAIDALGDASGMTYTTFGAILADAGIEMTDDIVATFTESMGGNKMRIKDFAGFAQAMGWDFNSEEYLSAFKSYNDGLIELNRRTEKAITSEIANLENAKPGDLINLTEFSAALNQKFSFDGIQSFYGANGLESKYVFDELNQTLVHYGAYLKDGILHLEDNANILGIAQTLKATAEQSSLNLSSEMAELADVIQNILKSYVDAIKKGISGGLSNIEADDLRSKALDLGIENLSFTETAEGLKLAKNSAIELYYALKQVDALQATLVFDELNKSLSETSEHYQSISSIRSYIAELSGKINKTDGTVSDARKQQYEQELNLAKEILAVRSTTEDSGMNFMSNKIPGAQNNPINYYQNWAQAFSKIRDSLNQRSVTHEYGTNKRQVHQGLIDYQDWYNIITEMGHLADQSGAITLNGKTILRNSEDAAKLIEAGAKALTVDKNGNVKVALSDIADLGIDFKTGAKDMAKAVDSGIHDLAESQVSMLDGLIALLEAIVAFEDLGDIDVDGLGIDLSDIFTITYDQKDASIATLEFTKGYEAWRKDIVKKIEDYDKDNSQNKDLVEALESIKLNIDGSQFSLRNMIEWNESQWKDKGELTSVYASLVNSLVQAAQSGDYDLDNIAASVQQELAASGIFDQAISIDVGDTTLMFSGLTHAQIKWSDEDISKLVKQLGPDGKNKLTSIMDKWVRGVSLGEHEIKYVLAIKKRIVIDDDGTVTEVTYNNHTYSNTDSNISEEQFNGYIAAAALEEQGFKPEDITIEGEKATTTITYKTGKKVVVESTEQDGVIWKSSLTNQNYGSEEAMQNAEWEHIEKIVAENKSTVNLYKDYKSKEEYIFKVYGKRVTIKPIFDKNGTQVDLGKDSQTRQQVRDLVAKGIDGVQELIDKGGISENANGTWTIDLGDGINFTFSGEEGSAQEAYDTLMQSIGLDSTMVDSIVAGITQAMSGEKVAGALGTAIATGLSADGVKIPAITINPENLGLAEGSGDKLQEAVKAAAADLKADIRANTEPLKADVAGVVFPELTVNVKGNYIGTDNLPNDLNDGTPSENGTGGATGTAGLAKAAGTLMGELGPELVVSNGRYFVVGQNGPEMVNLDTDAIVFNHLQTKSLLEKGTSPGRGKAITNERNAVSFAKGNIHGGPAKASASAALAALKQLRAQWEALAGMSAQDLAGKGGGGGGGGGDPKAFLKQLEKWYNWLQQIAKLEKDINLEETRRSKIQSDMYAHGQDYYKSQKASLEAIKQTLVVQDSLAKSQEEYFNQRREELNKQSAFSSLYKFSESGQLYYQPGALEWLSDLSGRNATTGEANYTAKEQYDKLVAAGYGFAMEYDSSGNKIKQEGEDWYSTALQAFWDKIDADKEEMQSLHDSVEDAKNNVLKNQEAMNQILRDIEDNQIAVEQKVLKAVEESRQRAIDDAQKQRDALEETSNNVINGLSEQLQKEQEMYSQQQETDELSKLQRQLAILQRSGGSASQIADLQQQIAEKQQNMYFDMQQKQIDALQEASDNELERLDHQIDIMTEQLEYEKENGLLWNQVYEVLQGNPEDIADFIQKNTSEYWGQSPTELAKNVREDLFEIQRFKEFQEDTSDIRSLLHQAFNIEDAKSEQKEKQASFIKGLYQELLGREADEGGLNYWLEQMANGMSEEDIRAGFMNSAEYKKLHGITDTSATNAVTASTSISNDTTKTKGKGTKVYYDPENPNQLITEAGYKKRLESDPSIKNKYKTKTIYKKGGMNYDTGLAWLDGTEKEPEAIFNAEQTRILRENILSSRPDSLVSLLKSYKEAYHGLSASTYDSISNNTNNATVIERAEVNLQVAQLANDYDSRRAANTIMDEMLRIASKTSANNSVRR